MEEIVRKKLCLPHTVFSQMHGLSRNVNVLINTQIYIPVMGRVEVCNNTSRYSQGSQNCNIEYHKSAVSLFYRHLESIFLFFMAKQSGIYVFYTETNPQKLPSDMIHHSHCSQLLRRQCLSHDMLSCHVLLRKS